MKNIEKNAVLILLIILTVFSCNTSPIRVEVIGPPIDNPTDTLVFITDTDLCADGIISFERQILPLVVSGCAYSGCHDTQTAEEGVILEDYNSIMMEVTPNDINNSELYKVITKNPNDNEFMPPEPAIAFTNKQIQLIEDWINQGAENTICNIPCNSENTSFANDVFPLIEMQCLGCHQPTNALGDVNLVDFEHVRSLAITGRLVGSIKYVNGLVPMPVTSRKMTDCQIATIQNWLIEGAQNN